MTNEIKAPMPQPKKPDVAPVFDENHHQTVASMKYGRVDSDYLDSLIMEHKADYERDPNNCSVSDELATVIRIVILKTLGDSRWRQYTKDWKEEMFFRAEYVALKYIHNYSPDKMAKNSKNNDPYYYIGTIVTRAFMQKVNDLKKHAKYIQFTSLNENIMHSCTSTDQYAGVLVKEEQRLREETSAAAGMISSIDEAIEAINLAHPEVVKEEEDKINEMKMKKKAKKKASRTKKSSK